MLIIIFFQGRLSILEPLGDVDYYPNGGQHQPGCTDACFGIFCLEIDLWDFFNGSYIYPFYFLFGIKHFFYFQELAVMPEHGNIIMNQL